ncbi:MAG TPA: molybdopterin-dependent oxidoreductase [Actinomycetota bacterium]|nr:molybdopterin-dependent oxidoreductase [Actinomycetota bacterium]
MAPRIPYPPIATAQWVVKVTPGGVATFFIDLLHHLALPLAAAATGAAFLATGALLGFLYPPISRRLGNRHLPAWVLLMLPVWAAPVALLSTEPSSPPRWVSALVILPPVLLGAVAAAWVSRGLEPGGDGLAPSAPPDQARRWVLTSLGVGAVGLVLGSTDVVSRLFGVQAATHRLNLPYLSPAFGPPGSASDASFRTLPGLTPEVTSAGQFYVVDQAIIDPIIDAETWRLSVMGLVRRPLRLSYGELGRLPAVERFQTLECISNPVGGQLISNARWEGIPLPEILDRAGVDPRAVEVVFRSADGYSDGLPIDTATDERTLIALGMNGYELTRAHGYPARLLSVGTYGMKNPKWLTSIEVVDRRYTGFWEERGWSKPAIVKTEARFDVPRSGSRIAGPTTIAGIAFGGARGISKVQASTDAGRTWEDAVLETALSPYTWVRWLYRWVPSVPGDYSVWARAFDGDGTPQPSTWAQPHPDGASGYPVIGLSVASTG